MTTIVTDLTACQVLAVADAALEIAETAGVAVKSAWVHAFGGATLLTADGEGAALALALGLTRRTSCVWPGTTRTIEVFESPWRGVRLTVQHCIIRKETDGPDQADAGDAQYGQQQPPADPPD